MFCRRNLLSLFLLSMCGLFHTSSTYGQQDPEKFLENFALSSDRASLLKELTPGTLRYYFFHALHYQTMGQTEEAQKYIDQWGKEEELDRLDLERAMRLRQAILAYNTNPSKSLEVFKEELNLRGDFYERDWQAPRSISPVDDASQLNAEELIAAEIENVTLKNFEPSSLVEILPLIKHPKSLEEWINRIDRVDIPNLPELISQQLDSHMAIPFGEATIHNRLTLSQLQKLGELQPKLRDSVPFVRNYLKRLEPTLDANMSDPAVYRDYLQRLEDYVLSLSESYDELQAIVLYHRMQHDEGEGIYDRERFLRYLRLPRDAVYYKTPEPTPVPGDGKRVLLVDLRYDPKDDLPRLAPIIDDWEFVHDQLVHFLKTEDTPELFRPWIVDEYLDRIFAETKILYGIGDPIPHYTKLSLEAQQEIRHRSELRFAVTNRKILAANDNVKFDVVLKNVSSLSVKTYRLDGASILRDLGQISTDIELEGLVPGSHRTVQYQMPSDRRHTDSIEIPEIEGRGIWVVDLVGGGLRARALIQKGQLRTVQRFDAGGQIICILNELGETEKNGYIQIESKKYFPNASGNILVPHLPESKAERMLVATEKLATLEPFNRAPSIANLNADFLMDPESLVAGKVATLLIRPSLLCNGYRLPLQDIRNAKLKMVLTAFDETESEENERLTLSENELITYRFTVPARLAEVQIELTGEYHGPFGKEFVKAGHILKVNSLEKSVEIPNFYLQPSEDVYKLYVLGRNGEAYPNVTVGFQFKIRGLVDTVVRYGITDSQGKIELGKLSRVEYFEVSSDRVSKRKYKLIADGYHWPSTLHETTGKLLRFPTVDSKDGSYSLVELKSGVVYADHSSLIRSNGNTVSLDGLAAGSYLLRDHQRNQRTMIHIVDGKDLGDWWQTETRLVEKQPYLPGSLARSEKRDGKWHVQLQNFDANTRVHVIGSLFHASNTNGSYLPKIEKELYSILTPSTASFYVSNRKVGDEQQYVMNRQKQKQYPGNMLAVPSWLLTPKEDQATENYAGELAKGDAMPNRSFSQPSKKESDLEEAEDYRPAETELASEGYHFLNQEVLVKSNLVADENGWVSWEVMEDIHFSQFQIVITHPSAVTYTSIPADMIDIKDVAFQDRRLKKHFDENQHRVEKQAIERLKGGVWNSIGEAENTRFRVISELNDLYSFYSKSCEGDEELWELFRPISFWPEYSFEEKCQLYEKLACNELHLFLYHKDRDFFDRIVLPYLRNKLEKRFIDQWLLGEDVSRFGDTWRFQSLKAVEVVLLSQKVPALREKIERTVRSELYSEKDFRNLRRNLFAIAMAGKPWNYFQGNLSLVVSAKGRWSVIDDEYSQWSTSDGMRGFGGMGGMGGMGGFDEEYANFPAPDELWNTDEEDESEKKAESNKAEAASVDNLTGEGATEDVSREELEGYLDDKYFRRVEDFYPTEKWRYAQTYSWRESAYHQDGIGARRGFTALWLDWLLHTEESGPFLSTNLDWGPSDFSTAIIALAATDLPWDNKFQWKVEDGKVLVRPEHDCIAFIERTEVVQQESQGSKVGVAHSTVVFNGGATSEQKLPEATRFTKGVPYQSRVVIMNPTDSELQLDVLAQIPQGAIPLNGEDITRSWYVIIAPYKSFIVQFEYYFPESGEFIQYGTQICDSNGLVASLPAQKFVVLEQIVVENPSTLEEILEFGSNELVLKTLQQSAEKPASTNLLHRRLNNKEIFEAVINAYETAQEFDDSIWEFAFLHNDEKRIRQWFENNSGLCYTVGPVLKSDLLTIDPSDRQLFEHVEFFPLIATRRHPVGNGIEIHNEYIIDAYRSFLNLLCYRDKLEPADKLQLVSFLLLQNRIEEAIQWFSEVPRDSVSAKLQYDYCDAYLAMYLKDYFRAREIAMEYADYPLARWRSLFAEMLQQLDDRDAMLAGRKVARRTDVDATFELVDEVDGLNLHHNETGTVTIRYYVMDIEALFSRRPFEQHAGKSLVWSEPRVSAEVSLESQRSPVKVSIPESLRNSNVLVQVSSDQESASRMVYSNNLKVTVHEEDGVLRVVHRETGVPLEATYVKVFSRDTFGSVEFYKDGYTDLRGEFDYLRQTTDSLRGGVEFAILIVHPEFGSRVIEL